MKVKKGDTVHIVSGKDRGKTGKVIHAYPAQNKVLVEGINVKKRHQRATRAGQKGQIIEKPHPVDVSNVMIIDPKTSKPVRVGYKIENGKKVRVAKRSGAVIA